MIVLSCKNIKKEYGTKVVLRDISFAINQGDKVALIGANGVGKSTLFKILTRQIEADQGDYFIDRNQTVGYLAQNLDLESDATIYEETLKVFSDLIKMEDRLAQLEEAMATEWTPDNELWHQEILNDYTSLSDLYRTRGGDTYRGRLHRVLTGLSLPESTWHKPINVLSGGEKTRVALAKLLLKEPSIILMDEPTNHLDLAATEWLEEFLKAYKGTLLVISHDRYFLDAVTDRTFLMVEGGILTYNAAYSKFVDLHKKAYEIKLKAYEQQQEEIKRQEAIIERYRSFNREKSIRAAESRQKRLDKMELIDAPRDAGRSAAISFKAAFASGNDVVEMVDLSKSFGEKQLFKNINYLVRRGDKLALIGENGRGKSTLFHIIRGLVEPDTGYVNLGRNVITGYYDQEQANLDPDKTVLNEVWDDFPGLTTTELRTALGTYLFRGDDVFKTVNKLSGGEKCRVNLLKLMLAEDNFLLLDEPTNHLDIPSREALEESLLEYDGTLLVISHDRYFLNKVAEKILELTKDGIQTYLGNYSYYAEKRRSLPDPVQEKPPGEAPGKVLREEKRLSQKEERKARVRLKEVEAAIEAKEAQIEEATAQLAQSEVFLDPDRLKETQMTLKTLEKDLEDLMEEWETLSLATESG